MRIVEFLFITILLQGFNFGDRFPQMTLATLSGETIILPVSHSVNLLFLFNSEAPSHIKMIEAMEFMIVNLPGDPIHWVCISSKQNRDINKLNRKLQSHHSFIIDEKKAAFRRLSFSCGACIKIFVVDKKGYVRYVSSSYDEVLLRTIVMRYNGGAE